MHKYLGFENIFENIYLYINIYMNQMYLLTFYATYNFMQITLNNLYWFTFLLNFFVRKDTRLLFCPWFNRSTFAHVFIVCYFTTANFTLALQMWQNNSKKNSVYYSLALKVKSLWLTADFAVFKSTAIAQIW